MEKKNSGYFGQIYGGQHQQINSNTQEKLPKEITNTEENL